jgi:hypothetical protein
MHDRDEELGHSRRLRDNLGRFPDIDAAGIQGAWKIATRAIAESTARFRAPLGRRIGGVDPGAQSDARERPSRADHPGGDRGISVASMTQ